MQANLIGVRLSNELFSSTLADGCLLYPDASAWEAEILQKTICERTVLRILAQDNHARCAITHHAIPEP